METLKNNNIEVHELGPEGIDRPKCRISCYAEAAQRLINSLHYTYTKIDSSLHVRLGTRQNRTKGSPLQVATKRQLPAELEERKQSYWLPTSKRCKQLRSTNDYESKFKPVVGTIAYSGLDSLPVILAGYLPIR